MSGDIPSKDNAYACAGPGGPSRLLDRLLRDWSLRVYSVRDRIEAVVETGYDRSEHPAAIGAVVFVGRMWHRLLQASVYR
jgi:hypothetical protein